MTTDEVRAQLRALPSVPMPAWAAGRIDRALQRARLEPLDPSVALDGDDARLAELVEGQYSSPRRAARRSAG